MTELSKYIGPTTDFPGMGEGVGPSEIGYLFISIFFTERSNYISLVICTVNIKELIIIVVKLAKDYFGVVILFIFKYAI